VWAAPGEAAASDHPLRRRLAEAEPEPERTH
jgi:hypothetical protein